MYRIVNQQAPAYLINLLPGQIQNRTNYGLRNRDDIDNPRVRTNLYANSFFPSTINLWNDLDSSIKSIPSIEAFKAHHSRAQPPKNPLYYFGGRLEAAIQARMRIGNSPLKADLCNHLHVIQSPLCPCGVGIQETARHFFFDCKLFNDQRKTLIANLLPFTIRPEDYLHLLQGLPDSDHLVNIHIFGAVHQFIRETKRFY